MNPTEKRYDERYFHRWYHGRGSVAPAADVGRRAGLALAAAEYVLEHEARSVLDIGCGEGRWRAPLKRLRPRLTYLGLDPSDWVVRRHGKRRNIRKGSLGELAASRLSRPFDLIVCSDVIHYVPTRELQSGLASLRALAGGVAWIDAFSTEDAFEGDKDGWQPRSAEAYRGLLNKAGFVPLAPNLWLPKERARGLSALERTFEKE